MKTGMDAGLYRGMGKRAFDLTAAAVLLVLASPLLAAVALLVRIFIGRPVWFRQQRPGLNGAPFTILKFRTMTDAVGANGELLTDAERLVPIGRALRRTSLDELPELLNVLKGDMSLVGPRPLLMEYLPRYSPAQSRRHLVRPGITGLAQVEGRNLLSWEEKFTLDTHYVDHVSLAADLAILCRTVIAVTTRRGVSQQGVATAEKFRGTE